MTAIGAQECDPRWMRAHQRGGILDHHNGELGGQAVLNAGEERTLMQVSARNTSDPEVVSLSFDAAQVEDAPEVADQIGRLEAEIIWGVQKGRHSARIDLRKGATVTLVANSVTVTGRYVADAGELLPGFRVGVSLSGGGARPGLDAPANTLTFPTETVANGTAGTRVSIPPYAVAAAYGSPVAASTATHQFWTTEFATGHLVAQRAVAPFVFVPIPGGASWVDLLNGSGGDEDLFIIFEIGL